MKIDQKKNGIDKTKTKESREKTEEGVRKKNHFEHTVVRRKRQSFGESIYIEDFLYSVAVTMGCWLSGPWMGEMVNIKRFPSLSINT